MSATIVEPKPGLDMGRVVVTVSIENFEDRDRAERGEIPPDSIRRITAEALVDSGATLLSIPESMIKTLGLRFDRVKDSRIITGPIRLNVYRGARLEVNGRAASVEVLGLPENSPVLLGQIPLETLDFWIDLSNHRLVGNPEHGGQWMTEVF
jgi:predicted aspartyl protease